MGKGKQAEEAEGMGGSKAGGSRHATGRNASGSGPIVENVSRMCEHVQIISFANGPNLTFWGATE